MGFARSICSDVEVRKRIKALQLELYKVAAVIATPPEAKDLAPEISFAMMESLQAEVRHIESVPGVLADGSLFWELPDAAALDVARTVCRRAEQVARRLMDEGELNNSSVLTYLNRLSDLLWLLGRLLESRGSFDS
jgi:cob(I)alamin adenosyltransferase